MCLFCTRSESTPAAAAARGHLRDDCAAAPGRDGRAGQAAGEPQARQLRLLLRAGELERARALVVTGSAQPVYRAWLQGTREIHDLEGTTRTIKLHRIKQAQRPLSITNLSTALALHEVLLPWIIHEFHVTSTKIEVH